MPPNHPPIMYPIISPVNISRPRLKQLATWIRDDLDILVAREGPDVLRPDDLLILHDTFVTFRVADNITVSDLRATGIHKAVQDISGVATRWPSRLCDDCDKIISVWQAKFGPFRNLHPLLYGRGGRLEGVSSIMEHSREALFRRWANTCPDKLHPRRSHRLGDVGFRAGAWWINSLFAHHAGIIGLESVEGGITYDKYGAYAVVLKDTGEVEASSMERFTYRCSLNDKGKYRLTSATPRSRDPVRVLRSHSINSVWGPKAGIRYEGLYTVKGWSIKAAKSTDVTGGEWKEGDIVFEIRFERSDAVSVEEVTRRPTAAEVDDYSEYKRLRKVHRDRKHKGPPVSVRTDYQHATKASSQFPPQEPTISPSAIPTPSQNGSPSISRPMIFKRPHFDSHSHVHFSLDEDVVSPMTVPGADHQGSAISKSSTLAVPTQPNAHRPHSGNDSISSHSNVHGSGAKSNNGSAQTTASTRSQNREVAPWVDFDIPLTLPPPIEQPRIILEETNPEISKSTSDKKKGFVKVAQQHVYHTTQDGSGLLRAQRERRKSGDMKDMISNPSPSYSAKRGIRKSIFVRSRNPMAKLFDGVEEEATDYFGNASLHDRAPSHSTDPPASNHQRCEHFASSDGTLRVHSPIPIRPLDIESPLSFFGMARRDAIYPTNDFGSLFPSIPTTKDDNKSNPFYLIDEGDPFVEAQILPSLAMSLPISLKNIISYPTAVPPMTSVTLAPAPVFAEDKQSISSSRAANTLETMMQDFPGVDIKVAFKDPFSDPTHTHKPLEWETSLGIAPDVVA